MANVIKGYMSGTGEEVVKRHRERFAKEYALAAEAKKKLDDCLKNDLSTTLASEQWLGKSSIVCDVTLYVYHLKQSQDMWKLTALLKSEKEKISEGHFVDYHNQVNTMKIRPSFTLHSTLQVRIVTEEHEYVYLIHSELVEP